MRYFTHPQALELSLSLPDAASVMLYQKHLILIPLDFFSIKSSSGQQFPRCDVTPSHTAFYPKRIHRRWRRRRMATLSLHTWQPRSSSRGCSAYLEQIHPDCCDSNCIKIVYLPTCGRSNVALLPAQSARVRYNRMDSFILIGRDCCQQSPEKFCFHTTLLRLW